MEQLNKTLKIQNQTTHSTREKNSSGLIWCTNSKALELRKTAKKYPKKKCEFCEKELEVIGFYGAILPKSWITKEEYERCGCEKAQNYWKTFDENKAKKKAEKEKNQKEKEYKENVQRLINKSNLGEKFKQRTFDTFKIVKGTEQAFNDCKRYAENFKDIRKDGTGIILSGSYGAGKTHLIAAIAHEVIKQGYQPIYGTSSTLLDRIRATYGDQESKETEKDIIRTYINCDLLIIDDLGKEKPSEWTLEKLFNIFNTRYENNKPVLITTNYTIEKLKDRLTVNDNYETAEAIVSRIYEVCQGVQLYCEDYRKKI